MDTNNIRECIIEFLTHICVEIEDVSIDTISDIDSIRFSIKTPDSGILIGNKGEHLKALTYILRRIIERRFPATLKEDNNYIIDVNDYQFKHINEIKSAAHILGERARLFKHDVELSPASAYERMIIHSLFSNDTELKTVSEGYGALRHIVIKYGARKTVSPSL